MALQFANPTTTSPLVDQVENRLRETKPYASSLCHNKPHRRQLPSQRQRTTAMRHINKANPSQAAPPLITALAVTSPIRMLTSSEQQTGRASKPSRQRLMRARLTEILLIDRSGKMTGLQCWMFILTEFIKINYADKM